MVTCDSKSVLSIYLNCYCRTLLNCSLCNGNCVQILTGGILVNGLDNSLEAVTLDSTLIVDLTTHSSVSCSSVENDDSLITAESLVLREQIALFILLDDMKNVSLAVKCIVACIVCNCNISCYIFRKSRTAPSSVDLLLSSCTGCILLLLHGSLEAFLIYGKTCILSDLLSKIERETICIVKLKCIFACKL